MSRVPGPVCLLLLIATAAGCASTALSTVRVDCVDADARLAEAWTLVSDDLTDPAACASMWRGPGADPCAESRRTLERLALACPSHPATLMANAIVAYHEHRPAAAQQFLDGVLALSPKHPEAAMLRARVALDEGNPPFARRLLADQIQLTPDHAGLREVYAGVLYLAGDLTGARAALDAAARLGAPRWRVAYHLGLVDEALGEVAAAIARYEEALAERPGWAVAESRLRGLRARP